MTYALPIQSGPAFRADVRGLVRQHWRHLVPLLIWHGLAVAMGVVAVTLFGIVVDESTRAAWDAAWRSVIVVAVCVLGQALFTVAAESAGFRLGEGLFHQLRDESVTGLLEQPLLDMESATVGELTSRVADDVDDVSDAVKVGFPEALVATVTLVFATSAAFVINWRLAPAFVLGYVWLVAATVWYVKRSTPAYDAELRAHADHNGAVLSAVRGARTVRQLNLGSWLATRISRRADAVRAAEYHTLFLQRRWFPAAQAAYYLPSALVLGWGGFLVARDLASVADVVALALYSQMIVNPLDDLLYWTDQFQMASRAFRRSRGFARSRAADGPGEPKRVAAQVIIDDASLEYPGGHHGIRDVTERFEPGTWVGVVGPSGAGKSSLGLLVANLVPPVEGRVEIVGEESGQARVLYVSQEGYVFAGSISDNLRLADPSATDDDIQEALTAVEADGWVADLDDTTATTVGMGGEPLTLAQSQQLALARVWLARPDIVVMDEATAALPVDQAIRVEQAVRRRLSRAVVVAIAHRLHTVQAADRILVVDGGRITQEGTHTSLLEAPGLYAGLWAAWNRSRGAVKPGQ
ncbi:MAG: ABC transporter ATP-binding protein/permease [Propionibacteriaceae bacterium]|jgi:ABC-type multidrug transport system fused ATPase/permease subunit|nr:ABC transporter ATP-binding protein/permease [Propionibacteriaceae bacterium]